MESHDQILYNDCFCALLMKIIRWASDMEVPDNIGLVIGNFDGVHRGHQYMLSVLRERCEAQNLTPCAMSFFPHPQQVIQKQYNTMITTLRDRAYWLENFGLSNWFLLPFKQSFREVEARQFIQKYLIDRLSVRYLLVGDDFRFGYQGKGDFLLLQSYSAIYFELEKMPTIRYLEDKRVSSSGIRKALQAAEMDHAKALLGHEVTFTAKVRHGDARGRTLSARTANLHVTENWCLPDGVYVIKMRICGQSNFLWGVANLGIAPTFGGKRRKLEAHIFDENCPDLYDQMVQISLLSFIRKERQFDDKLALQKQIFQDINTAKAFIAQQA